MNNEYKNRKDRYEEYTGKLFSYVYPFTWEDRSFNYLNILSERDFDEEQDYVFPIDNSIDWYENGE